MELYDVVKSRRSIRRYRSGIFAEEKLAKILESCNLAPSAGNLQAYRIIVVREPDRKKAVAEAAFGQSFIVDAGALIAFVADFRLAEARYGERASLYAVQDATIACTVAHLTVTDLGLGACWIGAFDDARMAEALEVPAPSRPVAVLAVGVPDQEPSARPRRDLGELVREERYEGRGYAGP